MPLELGIDLGCREFGSNSHRKKVLLVLDSERYRYQKFISDLAGQDPSAHANDPKKLVIKVRDWLCCNSQTAPVPGGEYIFQEYQSFRTDLPKLQRALKFDRKLNYRDYVNVVRAWLDVVSA